MWIVFMVLGAALTALPLSTMAAITTDTTQPAATASVVLTSEAIGNGGGFVTYTYDLSIAPTGTPLTFTASNAVLGGATFSGVIRLLGAVSAGSAALYGPLTASITNPSLRYLSFVSVSGALPPGSTVSISGAQTAMGTSLGSFLGFIRLSDLNLQASTLVRVSGGTLSANAATTDVSLIAVSGSHTFSGSSGLRIETTAFTFSATPVSTRGLPAVRLVHRTIFTLATSSFFDVIDSTVSTTGAAGLLGTRLSSEVCDYWTMTGASRVRVRGNTVTVRNGFVVDSNVVRLQLDTGSAVTVEASALTISDSTPGTGLTLSTIFYFSQLSVAGLTPECTIRGGSTVSISGNTARSTELPAIQTGIFNAFYVELFQPTIEASTVKASYNDVDGVFYLTLESGSITDSSVAVTDNKHRLRFVGQSRGMVDVTSASVLRSVVNISGNRLEELDSSQETGLSLRVWSTIFTSSQLLFSGNAFHSLQSTDTGFYMVVFWIDDSTDTRVQGSGAVVDVSDNIISLDSWASFSTTCRHAFFVELKHFSQAAVTIRRNRIFGGCSGLLIGDHESSNTIMIDNATTISIEDNVFRTRYTSSNDAPSGGFMFRGYDLYLLDHSQINMRRNTVEIDDPDQNGYASLVFGVIVHNSRAFLMAGGSSVSLSENNVSITFSSDIMEAVGIATSELAPPPSGKTFDTASWETKQAYYSNIADTFLGLNMLEHASVSVEGNTVRARNQASTACLLCLTHSRIRMFEYSTALVRGNTIVQYDSPANGLSLPFRLWLNDHSTATVTNNHFLTGFNSNAVRCIAFEFLGGFGGGCPCGRALRAQSVLFDSTIPRLVHAYGNEISEVDGILYVGESSTVAITANVVDPAHHADAVLAQTIADGGSTSCWGEITFLRMDVGIIAANHSTVTVSANSIGNATTRVAASHYEAVLVSMSNQPTLVGTFNGSTVEFVGNSINVTQDWQSPYATLFRLDWGNTSAEAASRIRFADNVLDMSIAYNLPIASFYADNGEINLLRLTIDSSDGPLLLDGGGVFEITNNRLRVSGPVADYASHPNIPEKLSSVNLIYVNSINGMRVSGPASRFSVDGNTAHQTLASVNGKGIEIVHQNTVIITDAATVSIHNNVLVQENLHPETRLLRSSATSLMASVNVQMYLVRMATGGTMNITANTLLLSALMDNYFCVLRFYSDAGMMLRSGSAASVADNTVAFKGVADAVDMALLQFHLERVVMEDGSKCAVARNVLNASLARAGAAVVALSFPQTVVARGPSSQFLVEAQRVSVLYTPTLTLIDPAALVTPRLPTDVIGTATFRSSSSWGALDDYQGVAPSPARLYSHNYETMFYLYPGFRALDGGVVAIRGNRFALQGTAVQMLRLRAGAVAIWQSQVLVEDNHLTSGPTAVAIQAVLGIYLQCAADAGLVVADGSLVALRMNTVQVLADTDGLREVAGFGLTFRDLLVTNRSAAAIDKNTFAVEVTHRPATRVSPANTESYLLFLLANSFSLSEMSMGAVDPNDANGGGPPVRRQFAALAAPAGASPMAMRAQAALYPAEVVEGDSTVTMTQNRFFVGPRFDGSFTRENLLAAVRSVHDASPDFTAVTLLSNVHYLDADFGNTIRFGDIAAAATAASVALPAGSIDRSSVRVSANAFDVAASTSGAFINFMMYLAAVSEASAHFCDNQIVSTGHATHSGQSAFTASIFAKSLAANTLLNVSSNSIVLEANRMKFNSGIGLDINVEAVTDAASLLVDDNKVLTHNFTADAFDAVSVSAQSLGPATTIAVRRNYVEMSVFGDGDASVFESYARPFAAAAGPAAQFVIFGIYLNMGRNTDVAADGTTQQRAMHVTDNAIRLFGARSAGGAMCLADVSLDFTAINIDFAAHVLTTAASVAAPTLSVTRNTATMDIYDTSCVMPKAQGLAIAATADPGAGPGPAAAHVAITVADNTVSMPVSDAAAAGAALGHSEYYYGGVAVRLWLYASGTTPRFAFTGNRIDTHGNFGLLLSLGAAVGMGTAPSPLSSGAVDFLVNRVRLVQTNSFVPVAMKSFVAQDEFGHRECRAGLCVAFREASAVAATPLAFTDNTVAVHLADGMTSGLETAAALAVVSAAFASQASVTLTANVLALAGPSAGAAAATVGSAVLAVAGIYSTFEGASALLLRDNTIAVTPTVASAGSFAAVSVRQAPTAGAAAVLFTGNSSMILDVNHFSTRAAITGSNAPVVSPAALAYLAPASSVFTSAVLSALAPAADYVNQTAVLSITTTQFFAAAFCNDLQGDPITAAQYADTTIASGFAFDVTTTCLPPTTTTTATTTTATTTAVTTATATTTTAETTSTAASPSTPTSASGATAITSDTSTTAAFATGTTVMGGTTGATSAASSGPAATVASTFTSSTASASGTSTGAAAVTTGGACYDVSTIRVAVGDATGPAAGQHAASSATIVAGGHLFTLWLTSAHAWAAGASAQHVQLQGLGPASPGLAALDWTHASCTPAGTALTCTVAAMPAFTLAQLETWAVAVAPAAFQQPLCVANTSAVPAGAMIVSPNSDPSNALASSLLRAGAAVGPLLFLVIGDGTAVEVQVMLLMLESTSAADWERRSTLVLRYFLSPFASLGNAAMAIGNCLLVAAVGALHAGATLVYSRTEDVPFAAAASVTLFPAVPMLLAQILYAGTVAGAFRSMNSDTADAAAPAGILFGVLYGLAVPAAVVILSSKVPATYAASRDWEVWGPLKRLVLPRGYWHPAAERRLLLGAHAWTHDRPRRIATMAPLVVAAFAALVLDGLPLSAALRYALVAAAAAVSAVLLAAFRPHRVTLANFLSAAAFAALFVLGAAQAAVGPTGVRIAAMVVVLVLTLARFIHTVAVLVVEKVPGLGDGPVEAAKGATEDSEVFTADEYGVDVGSPAPSKALSLPPAADVYIVELDAMTPLAKAIAPEGPHNDALPITLDMGVDMASAEGDDGSSDDGVVDVAPLPAVATAAFEGPQNIEASPADVPISTGSQHDPRIEEDEGICAAVDDRNLESDNSYYSRRSSVHSGE